MAAEIMYVDEPYLTVRRRTASECLLAAWKGFATSSEFRSGTTRLLTAIKNTSATAIVSDTRELELICAEDQLWIRDTWLPLAAAAGLKRVALLVAHRGLGKFAMDEMRRAVQSEIDSHVDTTSVGLASREFDSVDEAMKWADATAPV